MHVGIDTDAGKYTGNDINTNTNMNMNNEHVYVNIHEHEQEHDMNMSEVGVHVQEYEHENNLNMNVNMTMTMNMNMNMNMNMYMMLKPERRNADSRMPEKSSVRKFYFSCHSTTLVRHRHSVVMISPVQPKSRMSARKEWGWEELKKGST
jgi:hypothetical protein